MFFPHLVEWGRLFYPVFQALGSPSAKSKAGENDFKAIRIWKGIWDPDSVELESENWDLRRRGITTR